MIILFYTSLLSIVVMISLKLTEFRPFFISDIAKRFDQKAHDYRFIFEKKIKLYKKIIELFLFDFLPAYFYEKSVQLKDYLYKKYYENSSNLKGSRKILKSSGSVSSFLQEIKFDKPEGQNGLYVDSFPSENEESIEEAKIDENSQNQQVS